MKLKYLILFALGITFFACNKDDDPKEEPFDPAAQALLDDQILIEFLQSHYLTPENEIDTITNGEIPLYDIVTTDEVVYNEIDYNMYYYVDQEGIGASPTRNDSVQILYQGFMLDSTKFDENTNYTSNKSWFHLPQTIPGFRYGATYFKEGEKVIYPDESFGYENTGNGVFFMPSGLAYGNTGSISIPPNTVIYYFMNLGKVIVADADGDHVPNNLEDLDGDGDVTNDDTDGDRIFNYIDVDDDNDGKLTRNEDANDDGDPTNDDSDGDGIPDYLDADS